jgi:hypothetical protein
MKSLLKMTAAAIVLAAVAAPAAYAQVGVGVHVGGVGVGVGIGPAPSYYYNQGYYPPGPCDAYTGYQDGDCGYSVYTGPVDFDGVAVDGPHYYRWEGDQPVFWYRGGWHNWDGWHNTGFNWERHEGYGWHNGKWDRDYGRSHDWRHDDHDGDRDHDHHM